MHTHTILKTDDCSVRPVLAMGTVWLQDRELEMKTVNETEITEENMVG